MEVQCQRTARCGGSGRQVEGQQKTDQRHSARPGQHRLSTRCSRSRCVRSRATEAVACARRTLAPVSPGAAGGPALRSPAHARGAPAGLPGDLALLTGQAPTGHGHREWGLRPQARATRPVRAGRPLRSASSSRRAIRRAHRRVPQRGGGACGRRPHSRCPCRPDAWLARNEQLEGSQAGAPRAWAGERRRRRPAAAADSERGRPAPAAECGRPQRAVTGRPGPRFGLSAAARTPTSPNRPKPADPFSRPARAVAGRARAVAAA